MVKDPGGDISRCDTPAVDNDVRRRGLRSTIYEALDGLHRPGIEPDRPQPQHRKYRRCGRAHDFDDLGRCVQAIHAGREHVQRAVIGRATTLEDARPARRLARRTHAEPRVAGLSAADHDLQNAAALRAHARHDTTSCIARVPHAACTPVQTSRITARTRAARTSLETSIARSYTATRCAAV